MPYITIGEYIFLESEVYHRIVTQYLRLTGKLPRRERDRDTIKMREERRVIRIRKLRKVAPTLALLYNVHKTKFS